MAKPLTHLNEQAVELGGASRPPQTPRHSLDEAPFSTGGLGGAARPTQSSLEDQERGPHRRCIVTRTIGDRARMIRFVVGPDRQVVPDLAAKLPGRGMWLSARADVLETARARGAFARAARGPVTCPADLAATLQAGLRRRVAEHLGLARRAGQAVSGFARAREWIGQGNAAGVVQAADGSVDERARLLSGARGIWVAWPLTADALGAVFGRDHAVHVAIAPGRLAGALLIEIERLAGISGAAMVKQAGE